MTNGPEPLAEVSFELTAEEWADACASRAHDFPAYQAGRKSWMIAIGVIFTASGLFSLVMGGGVWALAIHLVSAAILLAITPWLLRRSLRRSLKRSANWNPQHGLIGPHRVELWPHGVLDVTPASEMLWRWPSIDGLSESDGTLVVAVGSLEFLPIPLTAFTDSETARRFGDVFFERLGQVPDQERLAWNLGSLPARSSYRRPRASLPDRGEAPEGREATA